MMQADTGSPRRVVLTNVFSDNNRGGAAITRATMDFARRAVPGCVLTLIALGPHGRDPASSHPLTSTYLGPGDELVPSPVSPAGPLGGLRAVVRSLRLLAAARRSSPAWSASLGVLRDAELVVSKGGFVFVERRSVRALMSFWMTVFPLVLAARLGVPTVVYGASVGPFASRLDRALNRYVLSRVTLVMPRDPIARQELSGLGIPSERIVEMPDSVFSLDVSTEVVAEELATEFGLEPGSYVVATARLRGPEDRGHLERVAAALEQVLSAHPGLRVVLVRQVTGRGTSDRAATEWLASELRRRAIEPLVIGRDLDVVELTSLYSKARLTIACRLHSAILSLVGGTPSVVLEMDGRKAEGIFSSEGLQRFVLPISSFTVPELASTVGDALDQEPIVRDRFRGARRRLADRYREAEGRAITLLRET